MSPASGHRASGEGPASDEYGITLEELRALMEYRGGEAREKIDTEFGGIEGLCQRLKTDPNNGIPNNAEELQRF